MGVVLILSLVFSGLGHFYLGDKNGTVLFMSLAVTSIMLGIWGVGYFMYPLVWVCGFISTFRVGNRKPIE